MTEEDIRAELSRPLQGFERLKQMIEDCQIGDLGYSADSATAKADRACLQWAADEIDRLQSELAAARGKLEKEILLAFRAGSRGYGKTASAEPTFSHQGALRTAAEIYLLSRLSPISQTTEKT